MLSGKLGSQDTVISYFKKLLLRKKPNRSEVNLAAVKALSKLACQKLAPFSTGKTLTLPRPFIVETETYNLNEKKIITNWRSFFGVVLEEILTQLKLIYHHGLGLKPCSSSQNYHRCMLLFCHFSHMPWLKLQLYKLLYKTMWNC